MEWPKISLCLIETLQVFILILISFYLHLEETNGPMMVLNLLQVLTEAIPTQNEEETHHLSKYRNLTNLTILFLSQIP